MLTSKRAIKHETFSLRTPPSKGPRFRQHAAYTDEERFRFCFLNNGRANGEESRRKIVFKYKSGAAAKELASAKVEEGMEAIRAVSPTSSSTRGNRQTLGRGMHPNRFDPAFLSVRFLSIAPRIGIAQLENSLEHAADIFDEIVDDIEIMMQQEAELYQYTAITTRNVLVYSIFSCVFLLLTGLYRVYATKTFFKQLKAV